jgi:hypothetical protein
MPSPTTRSTTPKSAKSKGDNGKSKRASATANGEREPKAAKRERAEAAASAARTSSGSSGSSGSKAKNGAAREDVTSSGHASRAGGRKTANGADRLLPVKALPSRSEREFAEAHAGEIDEVCAAWAAIVAERMAADQAFAESFEQFRQRPRDLRALFAWDQLHAAEAHVALVNTVIARHLDGRRADPFAILEDLWTEQRRVAVAYSVNAFLAVLNQMSPRKPKWLSHEDPRMAVLALAHQSLEYALEAARIEHPGDLTEQILRAAQDESVWSGARDESDRTLAACAAAAAFFRLLGSEQLATIDEVVTLYESHVRARAKS